MINVIGLCIISIVIVVHRQIEIGGLIMKSQLEKKVLETVSKIAMGNARKTANSACVFFGYQAKLPESVKSLKKIK